MLVCQPVARCLDFARHDNRSFFAVEVIRFPTLDNDAVSRRRFIDLPFPAVGIVTGIARCAAAARIIGNHVVNEVFVTGVAKLMGFAGLKEKGIARSDFSYPVLIANVSPTGNYEVKLRFRRMRVIGTKRLAFRNPHQREIKRMALCQIERVWMTTERDRNVLRHAAKLSLWRLPFLLWDIFELHFAHTKQFLISDLTRRSSLSHCN